MPFETPKTGRIAVRIITEYGEVMTTIHKIFDGTDAPPTT